MDGNISQDELSEPGRGIGDDEEFTHLSLSEPPEPPKLRADTNPGILSCMAQPKTIGESMLSTHTGHNASS